MYPDCLKDLVGLTTEPGQCLQGSSISNVSTLDLFVNQDPAYDSCKLKGGDTLCELIKIMSDMREEALRQITVDIGAMLNSRFKTKDNVHYYIGQNEKGSYLSSSLVPEKPFLEIKTQYRPGAFIRIDRIVLMILPLAGAMTIPLRVYKVYEEDDTELAHTFNIPVSRMSTNPEPVTPSFNIPCDGYTYRVEYTYDQSTMQVVDSNYHCGCGDKLKLSRGFIKENASKTYGISLYTTMYCQDGQVICSLLNNDLYRKVIGFMIRKMIITLVIKKIQFRQDVNRWTLLSPEDIIAQIASYEAEYASRLEWISEQKNIDVDGFCLVCDSGNGPKKYNMLTGR